VRITESTVRVRFCSALAATTGRSIASIVLERPNAIVGDAGNAPPDGREAAATRPLMLRALVADDFAAARAVADAWFGRPVGLTMHRLFFDQLGPSGLRAAPDGDPDRMLGVLLGFASLAEPELAYIHFVMVDPDARGRGVARALYEEFGRRMAAAGCNRVRTLAAPTNARSLRFHESLGFSGAFASEFVGPGQDRVVFERRIPFGGPG
jgi:ribosomal protein S18 acetylase RimI-like enzyme